VAGLQLPRAEAWHGPGRRLRAAIVHPISASQCELPAVCGKRPFISPSTGWQPVGVILARCWEIVCGECQNFTRTTDASPSAGLITAMQGLSASRHVSQAMSGLIAPLL
jgi:hypothetical protein